MPGGSLTVASRFANCEKVDRLSAERRGRGLAYSISTAEASSKFRGDLLALVDDLERCLMQGRSSDRDEREPPFRTALRTVSLRRMTSMQSPSMPAGRYQLLVRCDEAGPVFLIAHPSLPYALRTRSTLSRNAPQRSVYVSMPTAPLPRFVALLAPRLEVLQSRVLPSRRHDLLDPSPRSP